MKNNDLLYIYLLSVLLLIGLKSSAQTNSELFEQANGFYAKANFNGAVKTYKKIINSNKCSGELYYNLGNTYYKLDSIPQAILYYEKAKLLLPEDDDLTNNLKLANNKTTDKIEPMPQLFFLSWYQNFLNFFTTTTWAWLSIIASVIAFLLLIVFVKAKQILVKRITFFSAILILFCCIALIYVSSASNNLSTTKRAVVFTPSITIKSEPNATSTSLFVLHEGATCRVLEKVSSWVKVKFDNGNEGWLKETDIAEI